MTHRSGVIKEHTALLLADLTRDPLMIPRYTTRNSLTRNALKNTDIDRRTRYLTNHVQKTKAPKVCDQERQVKKIISLDKIIAKARREYIKHQELEDKMVQKMKATQKLAEEFRKRRCEHFRVKCASETLNARLTDLKAQQAALIKEDNLRKTILWRLERSVQSLHKLEGEARMATIGQFEAVQTMVGAKFDFKREQLRLGRVKELISKKERQLKMSECTLASIKQLNESLKETDLRMNNHAKFVQRTRCEELQLKQNEIRNYRMPEIIKRKTRTILPCSSKSRKSIGRLQSKPKSKNAKCVRFHCVHHEPSRKLRPQRHRSQRSKTNRTRRSWSHRRRYKQGNFPEWIQKRIAKSKKPIDPVARKKKLLKKIAILTERLKKLRNSKEYKAYRTARDKFKDAWVLMCSMTEVRDMDTITALQQRLLSGPIRHFFERWNVALNFAGHKCPRPPNRDHIISLAQEAECKIFSLISTCGLSRTPIAGVKFSHPHDLYMCELFESKYEEFDHALNTLEDKRVRDMLVVAPPRMEGQGLFDLARRLRKRADLHYFYRKNWWARYMGRHHPWERQWFLMQAVQLRSYVITKKYWKKYKLGKLVRKGCVHVRRGCCWGWKY
ncbi:hypothetical protein M8J76_009060 [Diaphorina citri]|nr:hypothetical protein M8J76_009060 [Diaphorina citri]